MHNLQIATEPRRCELLKEAVKALQEGIAFKYAKPLLAAEVRRILPSSLGVPMELGFYTAAVAAAALNGMVFFLFVTNVKHINLAICLTKLFLSFSSGNYYPSIT